MKKKIYSAVILLLCAAPALTVAADENKTIVHGAIDLGVQGYDPNGDKARFQEFRDMEPGLTGSVQLDAIKGANHLELDASNPGTEDQSFQLQGGKYENFKYKFHYNEMPHNYTFNAITPYTGLGTPNLTIVGTPANTSTWTKFDYAVDHRSYGGELEFSLHSPFFVKIGAERREQDGLRPYSIETGFGLLAEGPEPISHTTDNLHLKGGYADESFTISLTGSLSSFENDIKYFETAPNDANSHFVLPQDNDYSKLAADLSWRHLPFRSIFAAGASYANLENDYTATDTGYTAGMLAGLAGLNQTTFSGDIDYTNFSMALSSRPLDKLDTKVYYKYSERDNNSSIISYGAAGAKTNNAKELLSYEKTSAGLDLGYRLPHKTKLSAGYEYLDLERSTAQPAYTDATTFYRYDNPESTTDNIFFIGLKNTALDWLTAKVRYERLERDSDLNTSLAVAPTIYTTRFDAADKSTDEVKLSFDLYPVSNVDLGLDYTYKHSNYDWNNSSINDDKRQSTYGDIAWRAVDWLTLNAFLGYEKTETDANKRLNNALTLDRIEKTDDDFWTYGLASKIRASDKLAFNLSWQYQKSDGELRYDNSLNATTYEDITEADDYTKKTLEAKATYTIDPQLGVTVGYLYEKLEYSDINFANYANISAGNYYSGLYADPAYEAYGGYVKVQYGF